MFDKGTEIPHVMWIAANRSEREVRNRMGRGATTKARVTGGVRGLG